MKYYSAFAEIMLFRRMVVGCRGKIHLSGSSRHLLGLAKAVTRRKVLRCCDFGRKMLAMTCRRLLRLLAAPRLPHLFSPRQKLPQILSYGLFCCKC